MDPKEQTPLDPLEQFFADELFQMIVEKVKEKAPLQEPKSIDNPKNLES
jgi:hypothetical protein